MFLRHAQVFALGADAPDADFRDFKNHLLFPADNFWGGAPAKANCWYRHLVTALQKQEWQNAAYCAGVLSHYVGDAVHPLHTAQSRADNDIYAALAMNVSAIYDQLKTTAARTASMPVVSAKDLDAALKAGATEAQAQYLPLLAHFALQRALFAPAAGLDTEGRALMAAALSRAVMLVAAVLDAALTEAAVAPPAGGLTLRALQALAVSPVTAGSNWRHRVAVRRAVAAMGAEIRTTGHLEATLPDEMRAKRDAYAKEIAMVSSAAQTSVGSADNVVVFNPARSASPLRENDGNNDAEVIDLRRERRAVEAARPAPRKIDADPIRRRGDVMAQIDAESSNTGQSSGASQVEANLPAA